MDRQQKLRASATVPGLPFELPKLPSSSLPAAGPGRGKARFTQVSWSQYFDSQEKIAVGSDVFNVFQKGTDGPVLFLIHGGGFSALSWALFSKAMTELVTCRCVAMDLRGHGETNTANDEELSAETLSRDVGNVLKEMYPGDTCPPVVLIGHSLGGAISVHAAVRSLIPTLAGLVVIDVVEGTALDSLSSMESLVRGRPSQFSTLENSIEWSFRSGHIKNPESACVSMIGQLQPMHAKFSAFKPLSDLRQSANATDTIYEDPSDQESPAQLTEISTESADVPSSSGYTWRLDLVKTQPFWLGWFQGLSQMFLSCPVPKLLLLAGMDRLDKDLTIGQMQGKFQMVVLSKSGHAVQEDQPVKVAESLATFMLRNKIVQQAGQFTP